MSSCLSIHPPCSPCHVELESVHSFFMTSSPCNVNFRLIIMCSIQCYNYYQSWGFIICEWQNKTLGSFTRCRRCKIQKWMCKSNKVNGGVRISFLCHEELTFLYPEWLEVTCHRKFLEKQCCNSKFSVLKKGKKSICIMVAQTTSCAVNI